MKRKLGEPPFSKTPFARINELLAKALAYNIGGVIAHVAERGIEDSPERLVIQRPPRRRKSQPPAGGAS